MRSGKLTPLFTAATQQPAFAKLEQITNHCTCFFALPEASVSGQQLRYFHSDRLRLDKFHHP